jgi:transposase
MQVGQWFGEGRSHAQIAAELRVGLLQVEKWRRAWCEDEAEALRSRGPHRRQRLEDAQFVRLEAEQNRGPAAHGHADDQRCTLGRVAALIRRLFGITTPCQGALLRRSGWWVQVADRAAPSKAMMRPSWCGKSRCGRKGDHCGGPRRLDLLPR